MYSLPVYLLSFVLAFSPVARFSWDLWSQTILHVALAAALVLFLVHRKPEFRFPFHWLLTLFFAGACLSLWRNPNAAAVRNELLVLFDALAAGFLVSAFPGDLRAKLLGIPVLAGFFFSVILAFFAFTPYNRGYLEPDAIVNVNVIAGYLALAFPLSFAFWTTHGRQGWIVSAVIFAGILLTRSRTAMLFSSLAGAAYLWHCSGRSRRVFAVVLTAFLAVVAYAVTLKAGQDSLGSRALWWHSAVKMFQANPFNGVGWGNFGGLFPAYKAGEGLSTLYAHNIFLQIGAEGGVLALIPFLGLLCACFLYRYPGENRSSAAPLYLAAASFLAVNLFDYSFFIPAVMLLFFTVLGAIAGGRSAPRERPLIPDWGSLAIISALTALFLIPLLANRHYQQARYFLGRNDPSGAGKALEAALKLDSLPYQYYRASAETSFMQYARTRDPADLQTAITRQQQAIDRFPVNGGLWADLSWLYLTAGDTERAAEAMHKAAGYDPTNRRYRQALSSFGHAP